VHQTAPHAEDIAFGDLLAAVRRGDEHAADRLFRRIQPRLLRYLRSHEQRDAEDIAADVWLAVATGLDRFDGDEEGFRGWVFTIARRRLIDHRRRALRRPAILVPPTEISDREDRSATGDVASRNDSQAAADLVVGSLSQDQADVVLLRVLGDLDTDTVAEILGHTAGWVRVTQHRALKKLATTVAHPSGDLDHRRVEVPTP